MNRTTALLQVIRVSLALLLSVGVGAVSAQTPLATNRPPLSPPAGLAGALRVMSLEECLTTAMHSSHRRPASKFAVAVAEAQHRQALAGYWPQLTGKGGYQRLDEAPDILVPASRINVPASTAVVTVPAGVLGPSAVQLPVSTPAQTINVPAQDIKLLDPDNFLASVNATWLLYDGGMRRGYGEQTQGLVDMMKQEARRTDLEIVDSVKRYYYASVLARQLRQVGQETLARMQATLNLTESLYKEGSGKVKKTDFLDNKVMAETLRAMVAQLEKNEQMAQAALANTMGLSWTESIQPAEKELSYAPVAPNLSQLVATSYRFSPDWAKVEAAIRAAEGAVRTATSEYYPKLALTGELHQSRPAMTTWPCNRNSTCWWAPKC